MRFLTLIFMLCALPAYAAQLPPDEGGWEDEAPPPEVAKDAPKGKEVPPAPPAPIKDAADYNAVQLQGLNKVTGQISKIDAKVGKPERFGKIEIVAHRCWQASAEDRPENAALLEIREIKEDAPAQLFLGWMFSSSPGLSALEHPVYDVTVIACENIGKPAPAKPAPSAPAAKPAAKTPSAPAPKPAN